jgi:hypothetical protein
MEGGDKVGIGMGVERRGRGEARGGECTFKIIKMEFHSLEFISMEKTKGNNLISREGYCVKKE